MFQIFVVATKENNNSLKHDLLDLFYSSDMYFYVFFSDIDLCKNGAQRDMSDRFSDQGGHAINSKAALLYALYFTRSGLIRIESCIFKLIKLDTYAWNVNKPLQVQEI